MGYWVSYIHASDVYGWYRKFDLQQSKHWELEYK